MIVSEDSLSECQSSLVNASGFDLFDKQQQGRISTTDLETIMGSLNRDPNEIKELIENIDPNQNSVNFEEFIQLMQNVETRIVQGSGAPLE